MCTSYCTKPLNHTLCQRVQHVTYEYHYLGRSDKWSCSDFQSLCRKQGLVNIPEWLKFHHRMANLTSIFKGGGGFPDCIGHCTLTAWALPPMAALCRGVRPSFPRKSICDPPDSRGMMHCTWLWRPHTKPSGVSERRVSGSMCVVNE